MLLRMTMPSVMLSTPIGSHLYGLNHAGSDIDTYTVVSELPGRKKNKIKHRFTEGNDTLIIDWKTFHNYLSTAVPTALEALFSPQATTDTITAYRLSYRASMPVMHSSYRERIIVESRNQAKQRGYALRWALNFAEAVKTGGYFNPVLTAEQVSWIKEMIYDDNYVDALRSVFPYQISLKESLILNNIRTERAERENG